MSDADKQEKNVQMIEEPDKKQKLPAGLPGEKRLDEGYEGRPPNNVKPELPPQYLSPPKQNSQEESQHE